MKQKFFKIEIYVQIVVQDASGQGQAFKLFSFGT